MMHQECDKKEKKLQYWREWKKKNKEKLRLYNQKKETRIKVMLRKAKCRAKQYGIPFLLTESDITVPEVCPLLGIRLQWGGGYSDRDNSPSLDRLFPDQGYIPGNVWVISNRANTLKRDALAEELELLANNLKKKTKEVRGG